MVGYTKDGLARVGYYLSLVSGVMCALVGVLLLSWLTSLLLLGVMIVLAALLQRMTYKTLASGLTVLFSLFYLILWWFMTSGLSLIFGLQYAAVIGAVLGMIGGSTSLFAIRTL